MSCQVSPNFQYIHHAEMAPAANWSKSFSCTCTPFPGFEPKTPTRRLKITHGNVHANQHLIKILLWTLMSVHVCARLRDLRSRPKMLSMSSMPPRRAERSMTPIGTHVNLRSQLKRIVSTATVTITKRPPIIGVFIFDLRDSIASVGSRSSRLVIL